MGHCLSTLIRHPSQNTRWSQSRAKYDCCDECIGKFIVERQEVAGPCILHHATVVQISGESYRLKDKRRAGIMAKPPQAKPTKPAKAEAE